MNTSILLFNQKMYEQIHSCKIKTMGWIQPKISACTRPTVQVETSERPQQMLNDPLVRVAKLIPMDTT